MAMMIQKRSNQHVIATGDEADGSVVIVEGNWYFSPDVVDQSDLIITERTYTCPYKGICHWIDLKTENGVSKNIGFVYTHPMPGYETIKDRIAFYSRDTPGTLAQEIRATPARE